VTPAAISFHMIEAAAGRHQGPKSSYTATKRLGNEASRPPQIQDGKWKVVSDYVTPAPAPKP